MPAAISDVVLRGGEGGVDLAHAVIETLGKSRSAQRPLYQWDWPIKEKIESVAKLVYGADGVRYTPHAEQAIEHFTQLGYGSLPVCIAKTQHSLSDDPALKGAPRGWTLTVREIRPSLGAGFLVCLTGDVMTMPGLPREPAACHIDVGPDGDITGLR